MTSFGIVSCSKAHAEVIAALLGACFDKAWDGAAIAGFMNTPGAFGFILCRAAGGECEIVCLGVSAGRRRAGWAARLMAVALESAAGKGAAGGYCLRINRR